MLARPAQSADLDQRFRPLQWLLDEISLARAIGDRRGACVAALGPMTGCWIFCLNCNGGDAGLDHWALHDRILSVLPLCR